MRRQLYKEEVKLFEECLYLLREFVVINFGCSAGVWRFAEAEGMVLLGTRMPNTSGKLKWVGYIYDIEKDNIGYSLVEGIYDNFAKTISSKVDGALYDIRAALRNLSSIPIRVKKIDFSPDPMGFCDGFISESKEEKGSYDIELW